MFLLTGLNSFGYYWSTMKRRSCSWFVPLTGRMKEGISWLEPEVSGYLKPKRSGVPCYKIVRQILFTSCTCFDSVCHKCLVKFGTLVVVILILPRASCLNYRFIVLLVIQTSVIAFWALVIGNSTKI